MLRVKNLKRISGGTGIGVGFGIGIGENRIQD